MKRTFSMLWISIVMAACGKSPAPESTAAPASAAAEAPATAAAAGDPCTLLDDPSGLFGTPVTAEALESRLPNMPGSCQWKTAEGRLCATVMVFGPGWHEVPDLAMNYAAMKKSMGAFGEVKPLTGVGEEAATVDGGIVGAQVALRTSKALANIGAACGGNGPANLEHAEKVARAIAAKL